jgi:hypothetical protein
MPTNYVTSINTTDKNKVLLLIEASLQAYNAFDSNEPLKCQVDKIVAPKGFDFIEHWTGVDSVFNRDKTVECYGVVFRSQVAPYTYIFAFRGTSSLLDVLDDLGAEKKKFTANEPDISIASDVVVESGFFDVYSASKTNTDSMQKQLFQLLDKYLKSDKPLSQLFITGHSLGSALSELFTLDVALSRPLINASNTNFACPRVGSEKFVSFYEQQQAQKNSNTRTLRVQNTHDIVPCVPPENLGYQHISNALLIAFYKDNWTGKLNFLDSHSSQNYSAVLGRAAVSNNGVCVCEKLEVSANGDAVTSIMPDEKSVCSFW